MYIYTYACNNNSDKRGHKVKEQRKSYDRGKERKGKNVVIMLYSHK